MHSIRKLFNEFALVLIITSICIAKAENEISNDKVMVDYLKKNNYLQGRAEIVFLLDRSGSVGAADFEIELGFVESFLTHVVVDENATRVAVISYSDTAVRHIDYLKEPKTKCFLAEELHDVVYENSGATNIAAALEEARLVFQNARPNVNKVIVLISDGLATKGPDPVPIAAKLKAEGIQIFCFGVGRFLKRELESLASSLQHFYTCLEFREFKRLARKIRGDPHESSWSNQALKLNCDHLCDSPYKGEPDDPGCCDHDGRCSCALKSGMHSCVCNPGFYGLSGLAGNCKPCPRGTYKSVIEPSISCTSCPPGSTTAELATTKVSDCYCMEGYAGDPSKEIPCKKINCPPLQAPANGFILGPCDNIYGSTCHFMCDEGYELVNPSSDVRTCKSSGKWTEETAVCREMKCENLEQPRFGRISCESYPLTVGKKCFFQCYPGHIQEGSKERECLSSKNWSGIKTKCIPIRCEVPPRLNFGRHTCQWNEKTTLYDTCAYICNDGFDISGPRYLTCRENGKLIDEYGGTGKPICKDITPPEIRCPKPIRISTDKGKNTASVQWKIPVPTDNSGHQPKLVVKPPKAKPGQLFPIGNHVVIYEAIDHVGQKSYCKLEISVIDTEKPRILKCPGKQEIGTNSVDAPVYWDEPAFVDNSNKTLTISKNAKSGDTFGVGSQTVNYVAVDESRNFVVCSFEIIVYRTTCPYYPPPINGALTCNDWLYGQMCQTYCNEKYDFVFKPADWYICNSKTEWQTYPENEPLPWPDCAKPSLPEEVKQKVGFYYRGDCSDPRVQYAIKKLFLGHFANEINEADLCIRRGTCSVKTVQVKCGEIIDLKRRKRDVWEHAQLKHLELEFEITINADQEINDTEAVFQSFLETIRNLKWDEDTLNVETTQSPKETNFLGGNGGEERLVVADEKTTLICKPGSIFTDDLCVLCTAGTYYSNTLQDCIECPVGYYQEDEGQLECLKCPEGTSTEYPRTRNETSCKGICSQGTYSKTGLETCMSCPIGSFQDTIGKDFCQECPSGTTTESVGAVSEEDCKDYCPPGSSSQNGLQPCEPCPLHHFQPIPGQTMCIDCPNQLSTREKGANDLQLCLNIDPCSVENACFNNGECTREGRNIKCNCQPGFEGIHCEKDTDECEQDPCSNGALCINTEGSFYCNCTDGFVGKLCDVEIDECASSPCQNEGTCLDKVNGYTCVCTVGYEGQNCENRQELCFHDIICLNGGVCMFGDDDNSSLCMCELGFSGIDCSININDCENITCKNNGSCIDGINSYNCSCVTGFTGEYCETDIDECENNLCRSGSTCQDLIGAYKCICPPGWNGTHCEIQMENDFILMFPESSATIANMASMTLNSALTDATVSLWVQTNDTERSGTPLSYAVASTTTTNGDGTVLDNALTISDCSEVKIYVNNEPIVTDLEIADGKWHHLAFTWSSENSGIWALYKDGELKQNGKNFRPNDIIRGGGNMIIGQEQDTLGGGFSPIETFTGNISRVNIWNSYFSKNNITQLCNMNDDLPDKVLAWPDILQGLQGDIKVLKNTKPTFQ